MAPDVDDELVARTDERAAVKQLLDGGGPGALVLTGPPGIGKTAVWEWALTHASATGWRVLRTRCAAAEAVLPWVDVSDLLEHCRDDVWDSLPVPQRDAVDVVMLRARAEAEPPDDRAIGMALLSALGELGPVLIAIDDIGHLDAASARALRFAFRRLQAHVAVRVLATARGDEIGPLDVLPQRVRLTVGPLSVAGLFHLIERHLGVTFARPVLLRISEASGGNPLYALELARALGRREISPTGGEPLGLPSSLRSLVTDRIRHFPPPVRMAAAVAATASRLPAAQIEADVLATARRESLVEVEDGCVRAAHPLVAVAAYASLSDVERTELHVMLARGSSDPIERARQLALAVTGPDATVAETLDEATRTAIARGAPDAAAELARLAVDRTPDGVSERPARLEMLADCLLSAGDTQGAYAAQADAVGLSEAGDARARALIRLAEFTVDAMGWNAAIPILDRAIAEDGIDPIVAAAAHLTAAAVTYDDLRAANRHGERAAAILESLPDPDPAVLASVLAHAGGAKFRAGFGLDHERFRRAIALDRGRRLSDRADTAYAALLKYADDLDEADRLLTALLVEAESSGDVASAAYIRSHLPQVALFRGDLAAARGYAEDYLALAESAVLSLHLIGGRYLTSLVAAYDGRVQQARSTLERALTDAVAAGSRWEQQRLYGVLGFLDWSCGDAVAAMLHLDKWHALVEEVGLGEPGYARHHLDYIEVLLASDRPDDADRFLSDLDAQAERTGRDYAFAAAATGRALLASALGDQVGADAYLTEALGRYETLPLRFDRARCLLVGGQVRRRAKAKLAAQKLLTEAYTEFMTMGAPLWAERAANALARVNVRPRASADLTDTERQVAALAAQGFTNRQVAAAAFMSVKTVEANLARAYHKLGISSRAELGALLGRSAQQPQRSAIVENGGRDPI